MSHIIKTIAATIMIISVSACTNNTLYKDDSRIIVQKFSIDGFEKKQPITNSIGETMVQVCIKRDAPEIGNLWHCKSTIISEDNYSHTESDLYPIKNAVLLNLLDNKYIKVEGNVFGKIFKVEANHKRNQLTFKMSMPLKKDAFSYGINSYILTTVGVCSGTVNFYKKEEKNMLSEHCYYTYKKH